MKHILLISLWFASFSSFPCVDSAYSCSQSLGDTGFYRTPRGDDEEVRRALLEARAEEKVLSSGSTDDDNVEDSHFCANGLNIFERNHIQSLFISSLIRLKDPIRYAGYYLRTNIDLMLLNEEMFCGLIAETADSYEINVLLRSIAYTKYNIKKFCVNLGKLKLDIVLEDFYKNNNFSYSKDDIEEVFKERKISEFINDYSEYYQNIGNLICEFLSISSNAKEIVDLHSLDDMYSNLRFKFMVLVKFCSSFLEDICNVTKLKHRSFGKFEFTWMHKNRHDFFVPDYRQFPALLILKLCIPKFESEASKTLPDIPFDLFYEYNLATARVPYHYYLNNHTYEEIVKKFSIEEYRLILLMGVDEAIFQASSMPFKWGIYIKTKVEEINA